MPLISNISTTALIGAVALALAGASIGVIAAIVIATAVWELALARGMAA